MHNDIAHSMQFFDAHFYSHNHIFIIPINDLYTTAHTITLTKDWHIIL